MTFFYGKILPCAGCGILLSILTRKFAIQRSERGRFYFGYNGFSFLSGECALRSKWREIQATPLSFQRCIVLGTLVHCCTGT